LPKAPQAALRPRVALLVESSMASGRQILRGVARYMRETGRWSVYHEPEHIQGAVPNWFNGWQGDGVIARVRSEDGVQMLLETGLPVVDVLGDWPHPDIPIVQVNSHSVGELAASHFLDRGFRRFGFCGIRCRRWVQQRQAAFRDVVQAAGCSCSVHLLPLWESKSWYSEKTQTELGAWISQLPKPAGLMAANDMVGRRILEACRRVGVLVPEEVAVLGADNDEALCELCDPMLSSVVPVHDQVGYRAAMLLDELMSGGSCKEQELLLEPTEIVVRRSTDVLAVDDRDLAAAMRFIRENSDRPIGVQDVAKHVTVSRSTLNRRFQRTFERSVHDEILRVRLDRAMELLRETDLPLAVVSERTGFRHREYFGAVFKAEVGVTPHQFRKKQSNRSE
jgi:LacI family transcriptional regulator, galactose operon repressor